MNANTCECELRGLTCQHSGKPAARKTQRDILKNEIGKRTVSDSTSEDAGDTRPEWQKHFELN